MAAVKKRLTRIEPFSAAVMGGAIGFFLGLLAGVGTVLFFPAVRQNMAAMGLAQQGALADEFAKAFPIAFGWPALLLAPVGWAIGVAGAAFVAALFYNLLARRLGGIEFELEE